MDRLYLYVSDTERHYIFWTISKNPKATHHCSITLLMEALMEEHLIA